jgi:hypothetical protein
MGDILLSLLSALPGLLGNFFTKKLEVRQAEVEADRQIQLARQQLAGEIAKAELEKGTAMLTATGSKFKYITFFMWFAPFILGICYPPGAKLIFDNMLSMPDWYTQSVITIMFTVWGITVSSPVISNIFSALGNWRQGVRDYKLQKIDRKAYYEALRQQKGIVTPEDVKVGNAIMDALDRQNG